MISKEDIINETILLITKGESTSISELQYMWENFNQQPQLELVEDNYEYIVKINGRARAVSKRCFNILKELKEE